MGKPRRYNPWAICTASVGRKDRAKYERCVRRVKALYGYKNPAISAVWPKMTSRQRWAAMEFAGVIEMRARALAHNDWIDLPEDVKGMLLRGWNMGSFGGTRRRGRGETTRRMPVLTNPTEGWAVTHDGETLKQFGVGTAAANAAFAWLQKRQGQSVDWAIRYSGYDIVNVEGGKVVYSARRQRKPMTNPAAKPFAVQGSHTYLLTFKGGGWLIYESYDTYNDAMDMAKWLMKTGVAGVKGPVQTLILKPVNERRYTVFYRRTRRVAANGTKGSYPFADKQRQYRSYTIPQLRFALKDAAETARIWKGQDPATENWYRDDVFTISDEIKRREVRKNPTAPVWMQSDEAFYRKFGTVRQRLSQALARLTDAQKKEFHRRAEKSLSEEAVRWALREGGIGTLQNSGTQELPIEANKDLMTRTVKFLRRRGVKARIVEVERGRYRVRVGAGHNADKLMRLIEGGPWKMDDRLALTPRQEVKLRAHARRHGPISRPGEFAYWEKARLKQAARRNPTKGLKTYYVAKYRPAYPQKGEYWTASTVIDALPPTVVGKVFKIAARTKKDAIREAQAIR